MGRTPDLNNISEGQQKVTNFLVGLGLIVEVEKKIGSYRVDCYLPELKYVIEYDGPFLHHSTPQTEKRDKELMLLGVAKVIHMKGTSKEDLQKLKEEIDYV